MAANPFDELEQKLNNLTDMVAELGRQIHHLNPVSPEKPLNISEAAKYIDVAKGTMYHYTGSREIPHFKKGKRVYFFISDLDAWLRTQRQKTVTEIQAEA